MGSGGDCGGRALSLRSSVLLAVLLLLGVASQACAGSGGSEPGGGEAGEAALGGENGNPPSGSGAGEAGAGAADSAGGQGGSLTTGAGAAGEGGSGAAPLGVAGQAGSGGDGGAHELPEVGPSCRAQAEACDGDDDDCDGVVDNGCGPQITHVGFEHKVSYFDGDTYWGTLTGFGSPPVFINATGVPGGAADPLAPLTFHLGGPDAGLLDCPNDDCTFSADWDATYQHFEAAVEFAQPLAPGRYRFTVSVSDETGATSPTVEAVQDSNLCLWFAESAAGAQDGSSPDNALSGSLQAALDLASQSPHRAVCIAGTPLIYEAITLPSTPYSPDLVGGWSTSGWPNNEFLALKLLAGATLDFGAGYDGFLEGVNIARPDNGDAVTLLKLREARVRVLNYRLHNDGLQDYPDGLIGVDVADAPGGSPTELVLVDGFGYFSGAQDATGIRIASGASFKAQQSSLTFGGCQGDCRGLDVEDATVSGAFMENYLCDGVCRGVDLRGATLAKNVHGRSAYGSGESRGVEIGPGVTVQGALHGEVDNADGSSIGVRVGDGVGAAHVDAAVSAYIEYSSGSQTGIVVESGSSLRTTAKSLLVSGALTGDAMVKIAHPQAGTLRGIQVLPGAALVLEHTPGIYFSGSDEDAYAIDVQGSPELPATARIIDNTRIAVPGQYRNPFYPNDPAPPWKLQNAIAVRLSNTRDVVIANNGSISASGGRNFSAGIADGDVWLDADAPDGLGLSPGASLSLVVAGNDFISGGVPTGGGADCDTDANPIAPGVLLVGTQHALIRDNGSPHSGHSGIHGGGIIKRQGMPELSRQHVGVWLLDSRHVRVSHNELRSGGTWACTLGHPSEAAALRDGHAEGHASEHLLIERNGLSCAAADMFSGFDPDETCLGVELNAPSPAAPPVLVNNYILGTRGSRLVGIRQRGGKAVLAFNTIELGYRPEQAEESEQWVGDMTKLGFELLDVDGSEIVSNIVWVRPTSDPVYSPDVTRLGIFETRTAGTTSGLAMLAGNLFFLEGVEGATYVVVSDGADSASYVASNLDAVSGVAECHHNITANPLISSEPVWGHERSAARLGAGSPAIDAGVSHPLVSDDIDGQARPAGDLPDIGADEAPGG